MDARNNAAEDWSPMAAALEMPEQGSTLRDDWRFALESLGVREMFAGFGLRELALSAAGGALVWGGALMLLLGWG